MAVCSRPPGVLKALLVVTTEHHQLDSLDHGNTHVVGGGGLQSYYPVLLITLPCVYNGRHVATKNQTHSLYLSKMSPRYGVPLDAWAVCHTRRTTKTSSSRSRITPECSQFMWF